MSAEDTRVGGSLESRGFESENVMKAEGGGNLPAELSHCTMEETTFLRLHVFHGREEQ